MERDADISAQHNFHYKPLKFYESLNDIRSNYLYEMEFAATDDLPEAGILAESLSGCNEVRLKHISNTLKYSEVDMLFLLLRKCPDEGLKAKILYILSQRVRSKYLMLNWAMLQNDYTNSNLIESLEITIKDRKDRKDRKDHKSAVVRLLKDCGKDVLKHVYGFLIKEGGLINTFLEKYSIRRDSRLAQDISLLFFSECDKEGFDANRDVFSAVIGSDSINSENFHGDSIDSVNSDKVVAVIANYLSKMKVLEYFNDINLRIIERYKLPDEDDAFWNRFSSELKRKFTQWVNVNAMETYFEGNTRKFFFWRSYYKIIKMVRIDTEAGLLFMDFGKFVVVDIRDMEFKSFIYSRKTFQAHYDNYVFLREVAVREAASTAESHGGTEIGSAESGSADEAGGRTGSVEDGAEDGGVETGSAETGIAETGGAEDGSVKAGSVGTGSVESGSVETSNAEDGDAGDPMDAKDPGAEDPGDYEVGGEDADDKVDKADKAVRWDIPYDIVMDARIAINNEAFSEIYMLNFERVGILYARDLIDRELSGGGSGSGGGFGGSSNGGTDEVAQAAPTRRHRR